MQQNLKSAIRRKCLISLDSRDIHATRCWALDAIYAVFDRDGCYQEIVRQGGRFSRWLLGLTKWKEHGEAEQRLLLSMMWSCGVCFLHRRMGHPHQDDPHDEYIAPELLPPREAVEIEGALQIGRAHV